MKILAKVAIALATTYAVAYFWAWYLIPVVVHGLTGADVVVK
jgi:hypothetical protein